MGARPRFQHVPQSSSYLSTSKGCDRRPGASPRVRPLSAKDGPEELYFGHHSDPLWTFVLFRVRTTVHETRCSSMVRRYPHLLRRWISKNVIRQRNLPTGPKVGLRVVSLVSTRRAPLAATGLGGVSSVLLTAPWFAPSAKRYILKPPLTISIVLSRCRNSPKSQHLIHFNQPQPASRTALERLARIS